MTNPGAAVDYTPLGTSMEFEDLTLPRDKFNRFRYFFIVFPRFTFALLLDPVIIGIFSVWLKLSGEEDDYGLAVFGISVMTTMLCLSLGALAEQPAADVIKDTRNSISFLGEIVKFRPGLDENKWDLIAARTNRAFHHNDNKITPYFFYDGAKCHSYFKSEYVDRAGSRKANDSETASVGVQPIIDEALKVYTDSLREYWGQYMAEINDISEHSGVRNDSDKDQTVS